MIKGYLVDGPAGPYRKRVKFESSNAKDKYKVDDDEEEDDF